MRFLPLFLFLLTFGTNAWAQNTQSPRDPGIFYDFVHSFAPETAVGMWRGNRDDLPGLLASRGFQMGNPVFLRIFKEEGVVELWLKRGERFELFEIYPVCNHSGALGPKLRRGDGQAPEGFYEVNARHLHNKSKYHLAINMGYPNAYDRAWGRTGDFLMIHGACASIGCYAMTNDNVEEVYRLIEAALAAGQVSVPIHAFPFRMTADKLARHDRNGWMPFWLEDMLPVYQTFQVTGLPPMMMVCDRAYRIMPIDGPPEGCTAVEAWRQ